MRTRVAILVCLASLASCAVPRTLLQVRPHVRYIKTDLPLTFAGYQSRYPVVTVGIQGRQYRLILDTGSPDETIALTPDALGGLHVRYTGRTRIFRDAYGSLYDSREFVIPSARLGDLEVRHIVGNERHNNVYGLDGAVGLGLLGRFDVLIDYGGGKLTLHRSGHDPAFLSDGAWFRYSYRGNLCLDVEFDFLDGRHELCLDSGCGCNFVGARSSLGRAIRSALDWDGATVTVAGGGRARCLSYSIDHLYLEDYDLGGGHFVLGDLPDHMNNGVIGYDLFANNTVYLRFSGKEIWLRPVSRARYAAVPRGGPAADQVLEPSVSGGGHSGGSGSLRSYHRRLPAPPHTSSYPTRGSTIVLPT